MGGERLENGPKSGRRINKTTKQADAKIKELLKTDAKHTLRDLAKITGISASKVHFILKKKLLVRKSTAGWIPHLLSKEQNRARVFMRKKKVDAVIEIWHTNNPTLSRVMKVKYTF